MKIVIKAMNDITCQNGLVPSRSESETMFRFSIFGNNLSSRKERMKAIKAAQFKMNTNIAPRRISEALTSDIPPAATSSKKGGKAVLVYPQNRKEQNGVLPVTAFEKRLRMVKDKTETFNEKIQIF